MPGDPELPLDAWGDLRVGDRVYMGPLSNRLRARALQYVLVELRSTTAPISGDPDALAVIRDAQGETHIVNARVLRRV